MTVIGGDARETRVKTGNQTQPDAPDFVPRRRATDALPRERREGASRLATWSGRGIALLWLAWPCAIALLLLIAAVLSIAINHGTQELPPAFTKSNVRGLILAVLIPPSCLTILWWRMHGRRRPRRRESGVEPR